MAQTLYRKYRPQTFADIIGQEHVTQTLQNQIKHDKIAHAYLFSGPRGIGKTTTARLLAKAAQAHDKNGEPDEAAMIVKSINAGTCLDLVEIDAASNRRIEEIRELREHIKYPPNQAKYKIFIIDEVHMLTTEAFNALLKTLEEPPAFVIFILATTELNKLPDTIISRCQRFDFKLVEPEVMQQRLEYIAKAEKIKVDHEVLRSVVKLSDGCVRDAESLFGQILSINKTKITAADVATILPINSGKWIAELWQSIVDLNINKSLEVVHALEKQGIDMDNFFADWLEFMRLVLLWRVNPKINIPVFVIQKESINEIKDSVTNFSVKQIQAMIDIFLHYHTYITLAFVKTLPLEMSVIAIHELLSSTDDVNKLEKNNDSDQVKSKPVSKSMENSNLNPVNKSLNLNNIIAQIKVDNPGLAQYLINAELIQKNQTITIFVGHSFHYEVLRKEQSLKVLDKFFKVEFGENTKIFVELNENLLQTTGNSEPMMTTILNTFGGQIIED